MTDPSPASKEALQLQPEFRRSSLNLFREDSPCAVLRLVNRVSELGDPGMDMLPYLLDSIFQDKLIERHQRECRIAGFNPDAIPRSNFSDEPVNIDHSATRSKEGKAIDLLEPVSLHNLQTLLRHDRERSIFDRLFQRKLP